MSDVIVKSCLQKFVEALEDGRDHSLDMRMAYERKEPKTEDDISQWHWWQGRYQGFCESLAQMEVIGVSGLHHRLSELKSKVLREKIDSEKLTVRLENAGDFQNARTPKGRHFAFADVHRWLNELGEI